MKAIMRGVVTAGGMILLVGGCGDDLADFAGQSAFVDVTGTAFSPAPTVAAWPALGLFDYDNDGDIDIFITNPVSGPNLLYQNDGRGEFVDVGTAAGIQFPADDGVCVGVGDFDNDGWLDLIIGRQVDVIDNDGGPSLRYLKNLGPDENGTVRFADRTKETGLDRIEFGSSIGVGDIDNDGLLDLYIGRYDFRDLRFEFGSYLPDTPSILLRNTAVAAGGVPFFEDITDSAGVGGTRIAGLAPESADILNRMPTWSVYLTDVNADGLLDIFALHEIPGGVDLFINNGDLTFTPAQAALLNKQGGWMGIAGADYDRDGHIDYFVANVGADAQGEPVESNHVTSAWRRDEGTPFHRLLHNSAGGVFTDVAASTPVANGTLPPTNALGGEGLARYEFGFGCAWLDVQNDGWPDLTWTGDIILFNGLGDGSLRVDFHGVSRLLLNTGGDGVTGFADATAQRGLFNWSRTLPLEFGFSRMGRALAAVDLNGDGFTDVCRTNLGLRDAFQCLQNPALEPGHWIIIRLEGSKSNRFGIGARVEARSGGDVFVGEVLTTTSAFAAVHPQVHFGLGAIDRIETLTVRWPSGAVSVLEDLAVDRIATIREK